MKRVGFVSTRIAGTDGVTLETYKWHQVLERNGYECYFFGGELDTPEERSLLEPKAYFGHPEILETSSLCFGKTTRRSSLSAQIQDLKDHLKVLARHRNTNEGDAQLLELHIRKLRAAWRPAKNRVKAGPQAA